MALNPVYGAGYLLEGIRLIAKPGLRRFVMVPLIVNVLVFSAGIAAGVSWFRGFVGWMDSRIPSWLQWLDWVLWPLFVLLLLLLVFYGFGLLANLIAAPFNSLLAEQVERHLTGQPLDQEGGIKRMLRELLPTLLDELKKILYALALAVPFLLLLWVPVVGALLWLFYTSWVLAVQYADYPMGNHGLKLREMRKRLKERRWTSLGFGAATAGLGMVPVLNFIAMPAAVAGATALWVRELKGGSNYQGPHQSRVATRVVLLAIDQLSGRISGELLEGVHRGKPLDAVPTEDLRDLLKRCFATDVSSAEALEVYLERERGEKISRPEAGARASESPRPPLQRMVADEARAILGVGPEASPDDIRTAHKKLMQRLHPDRGGSDYLAAKINEAKDVLLG
jgi:CysZ protein